VPRREGVMRSIYVFVVFAVVIMQAMGCDQASTMQQQPGSAEQSAQAQQIALGQFQKNSPRTIETYLRDHPIRKVQLGAGASRLKGWLNTDIEPGDGLAYLDATKPFPFDDGAIHYIFSEHVIEHLNYDEGKAMIAEAFRVLAPGGRMRISTPDMMQFIALFDKTPSEEAKAYIDGKRMWHEWPKEPHAPTVILNLQMSSWGHKFMYDFDTLAGALTRAGFQSPQEFEENISSDAHLRNLEERDTGVNVRWSDYETMSVEVEKPRITTTR
jgi:predicted SAM-dependent methyltransferase